MYMYVHVLTCMYMYTTEEVQNVSVSVCFIPFLIFMHDGYTRVHCTCYAVLAVDRMHPMCTCIQHESHYTCRWITFVHVCKCVLVNLHSCTVHVHVCLCIFCMLPFSASVMGQPPPPPPAPLPPSSYPAPPPPPPDPPGTHKFTCTCTCNSCLMVLQCVEYVPHEGCMYMYFRGRSPRKYIQHKGGTIPCTVKSMRQLTCTDRPYKATAGLALALE